MSDGVGMEGRRQGKGCDGEARRGKEGRHADISGQKRRDKRMDTEVKRMEGHDNEDGGDENGDKW